MDYSLDLDHFKESFMDGYTRYRTWEQLIPKGYKNIKHRSNFYKADRKAFMAGFSRRMTWEQFRDELLSS